MAIKNDELTAILAEVESDLQKAYQEGVTNLKKGLPPPPEEDSSAPASPPADEGSGAPADDAAMSAPPADAGGPPPGPDASAAPAGDPAAEQGQALTPEALQAEYSQLQPEELDMHIQAALAAKEALSGAAGAAPAEGSMSPPGGMPPAAPEASMPPPPAQKAELKTSAIGGDIKAGKSVKSAEGSALIEKSELAAVKAAFDDLKKNQDTLVASLKEDVENLTKAITIQLERPMRKAITSIADLRPVLKTEAEAKTFTKAEVSKLVGDNAHNLTKAERELWIGFIDNKVSADKLAPMLDRLVSQK